MSVERVDTLVVGAGQAGIAMSEHLSQCGVPHLVLERHRIAERWRSGRWDSLVANGPAWHDRFPGMEFPVTGPDGFPPKEEVADYFAAYAQMIGAPVRCGVEVKEVRRLAGRPGFRVDTSAGVIEADSVVAATVSAAGAIRLIHLPMKSPGESGVWPELSAARMPPQRPWPMTTMCFTFRLCTANSSAAEVEWNSPSGS